MTIRAYTCVLCGQRIDDGKPCGCGARPFLAVLTRAAAELETRANTPEHPLQPDGRTEIAETLLGPLVDTVGWATVLNVLLGVASSWHRDSRWHGTEIGNDALSRLHDELARAALVGHTVDDVARVLS